VKKKERRFMLVVVHCKGGRNRVEDLRKNKELHTDAVGRSAKSGAEELAEGEGRGKGS